MSKDRWLALKLTHTGEATDEFILIQNVYRIFGEDADIFFPYKSPESTYSKRICVLDGYIFIQHTQNPDFMALNRSYYFEQVNNGISYTTEEYIATLKNKLRDLCEKEFVDNEYVIIVDGPYENLEGKIIRSTRDTAVVHIAIRSRTILVEIPKVSIQRYCP